MEWKDIAHFVAKSAPILGAALGGPIGAIAGAAGSIIASTLGVEATPAAIASMLQKPEVLIKLKELEMQERVRFMQWQEEQMNAELNNVKDARAREVNLARLGHGGAWVTGVVSLVVVLGFFWMLTEVINQTMINEPALLLLGSLGTAFGSVVNYYLGSSIGSYRKDSTNVSASLPYVGGK